MRRAVILIMGVFLLGGCVAQQPKGESVKDDSDNVRISGDMTVSSINRSGF
ncbi:MAG: hypothetical protein WC578_06870 [Candidatus Omnitrophota bacterium]